MIFSSKNLNPPSLAASLIRTLALVIALVGIVQLRAQPLDTLNARLRGLPIDSVEEREREATDPRTKFVTITRLTGE